MSDEKKQAPQPEEAPKVEEVPEVELKDLTDEAEASGGGSALQQMQMVSTL